MEPHGMRIICGHCRKEVTHIPQRACPDCRYPWTVSQCRIGEKIHFLKYKIADSFIGDNRQLIINKLTGVQVAYEHLEPSN